ncbi:phosphopantetheine-binding protein [Nocardia abscessus]|uniref:phosphopantetheine-binding protein n=1 Tax=Nocardia abscessus TaxID=120957 RepID=UPI0005BCC4EA|nr:phosphopantetheine-binding protein [Nocardia abscessus]MCC3327942.1 phosphopantetheine-binding protein [Nocardia abscessus]
MSENAGQDYRNDLERIVRSHLTYYQSADRLDPDVELSNLGLDSLTSVRLLVDIESSLEIEIPFEDLVPETFRTLGSLNAAVKRAIEATGEPE